MLDDVIVVGLVMVLVEIVKPLAAKWVAAETSLQQIIAPLASDSARW